MTPKQVNRKPRTKTATPSAVLDDNASAAPAIAAPAIAAAASEQAIQAAPAGYMTFTPTHPQTDLMRARRAEGGTFAQIAAEFDLSPAWARAIVRGMRRDRSHSQIAKVG